MKDELFLVRGGNDPCAMYNILAAKVKLPLDLDLNVDFDKAIELLINMIKTDAPRVKELCQTKA